MLLKLSWVGVALALALGTGASAAERGIAPTPDYVRGVIEAEPSVGKIFAAIRKNFPEDYDALVTSIARAARPSTTDYDLTSAAVDGALVISKKYRPKEALASADKLAAEVIVFRDLIRRAQRENPEACAQLMERGAASTTDGMSTETDRLIGVRQVVAMEAMGDGLRSPVIHGPVTDDDMEALGRIMEATHRGTYRTMTDRDRWVAAGRTGICEVGVSFYEALASLPPAVQARFRKESIERIPK